MVRKLTAALLGVGVMVPGLANALGLGEIKLNSHLSEPLDAEIELVQTRELTESEILPGLASIDDFEAAGVERFHHLTDMKFDVVVNNNGRSYIKVRSRKPIREPFVNFLVEVHWPAGRLLREYTLLLDPPNFSLAAPQPVQPAVTTTAAPTTVKVTSQPAVPASTQSAVVAPTNSQPASAASGAKTYGPTQASDSLWSIARALRPSNDVSIQQTMIAIQQLNPNAFINGNINLLKKGQVLRGPSVQEVREISSREAISQVNQQNRAWKERIAKKTNAANTETAQIDTSGRAVNSLESAVRSEEGRLRLVSADVEATGSDTGQGGEADDSTGGVLRDRAELAEETADQYRLENEDLKSKVNELEEQVDTGEKLIDLKNDQIAALQARLAKMEEELQKAKQQAAAGELAVDEQAVEAVVSEEIAADASVAAEPEESAVEAVAEELAEEVVEQAQEEVDYNFQEEAVSDATEGVTEEGVAENIDVTAEGITVEDSTTEESEASVQAEDTTTEVESAEPQRELSVFEQVLSNKLYMSIAGGVVAVLAVLGVVLGRRRKDEEDELEEALVEDFSLDIEEEAVSEEAEETLVDTAVEEPVEETVAQTADVLGEADIYIAYGRFPQAIEMLEKAADAEPQRGDIRIKLLETAVEAQDKDTFARHYQGVQELGVPGDIERADALKSQFIGNDDVDFDTGEQAIDDEPTLVAPAPAVSLEEPVAEDEANLSVDFEPAASVSETFDSNDNQSVADNQNEEAPLEFDSEFSLDTEKAEQASLDDNIADVSFDEAEKSLDFELDDNTTDSFAEDALEFDLDLDSDDKEKTVAADLEPEADEVIGSSEAAMLADELDLDGDFDLGITQTDSEDEDIHVELETASEESAESEPAAVEPALIASAEDSESEEDLGFLSDADEASTKLDLARAYIDMGDREGAKDILDEVLVEGNDEQQSEAKELLAKLD